MHSTGEEEDGRVEGRRFSAAYLSYLFQALRCRWRRSTEASEHVDQPRSRLGLAGVALIF